ncbi:Xylose isomerase domain protein TIM barrel [Thermobaculum terrenum ATCC BAA-798]|uniref:Xylose isomerase domain protein TIM barrel n=1 Tax=Thermobaculum terrenum (strain ATCC BAA-798 / CCMEE 7001 / YNP1) TaxID=525904 RepID=D1CD48_THET1|nr:sugar phosphate isomerase/epimerase [Thermobaculum terrenum]ACZ42713.1 Xylose isomerase domain protein TIM barrel [Thermobaculum terrenum ATCC BAA-798]
MYIGVLTAPVREKPLSEVITWASSNNIAGLEVDVSSGSHLDATTAGEVVVENTLDLLKKHNVKISALAAYTVLTGTTTEKIETNRRFLERAIALAARLGVDTICTLGGFPSAGKDRFRTIKEDLVYILKPLLERAQQHNIRIALENWYATNLQNLDHWVALFESLPNENLGLNFDPSHLAWQGIDPIGAIYEFRDRIFHFHAKDVTINASLRSRRGILGEGWWRYVLPGYGVLPWGEIIGALRDIGYNGAISIEHEDRAFPIEEGFIRSSRFLSELI